MAATLFVLAAFSVFALEIYRPENYGELNTKPCKLIVRDADGNDASDKIRHISYSWYYELPRPAFSAQPKKLHTYFNGCFSGGVVVHLIMEPGVYRISVQAAESASADESAAAESAAADKGNEWTSNEFLYDSTAPFPEGKPRVIWVVPCANDNGFFNGSWRVEAKSPEFYKYTKPHMP